jgi:hypothetical protein
VAKVRRIIMAGSETEVRRLPDSVRPPNMSPDAWAIVSRECYPVQPSKIGRVLSDVGAGAVTGFLILGPGALGGAAFGAAGGFGVSFIDGSWNDPSLPDLETVQSCANELAGKGK